MKPVKPGWRIEIVWLDVERATKLKQSERRNRHRKTTPFARFVADLREGRWGPSPQLIAVDWDETLIDGGHRCDAVIETGVGMWVILVTNVDPVARETIDAGSKRSMIDQLVMLDESDLHYPNVMSAAVRCLAQDDVGVPMGERWSPGVPALVEKYHAIGQRLKSFPVDAARINSEIGFGTPGVLCGQMFLMHERDPERAPNFFRRLETGLHLVDERDQIAQLRRILNRQSSSRRGHDPIYNGGLLRKAFNGWRQESHKALRYDPKRERYPEIYTWPEIAEGA